MSKLHQYDFFYGAILNTIISQNPDACPTLLEIGEEKSVYKVTTNSSEKDMIVFCKYATVKDNKSDNYKSWTFAFSDTDNLSLDMDYADSLDEYVDEVDCIEQELYLIKDTNDVLYATLERIAWQNPDYYQWYLLELHEIRNEESL